MNVCQICNKPTSNIRFCSRVCYGEWRKGKTFRKKGLVGSEIRVCPTCSKSFKARTTDKKQFCSYSCYWSAKRPPRPDYVRNKISKTNRAQRDAGRIFFSADAVDKSKVTRAKRRLTGAYKYCGNWRGGLSFIEYPAEFRLSLKEAIRIRDYRTCQMCGTHESFGTELLSIHHVDGNKKNCANSNLIALCRSCHSKTYGRLAGDSWKTVLQNRVFSFVDEKTTKAMRDRSKTLTITTHLDGLYA